MENMEMNLIKPLDDCQGRTVNIPEGMFNWIAEKAIQSFVFFKRALPGVLMETDNTQVATYMLLLSDFNQLKHTKLCTQSHNVQIVIHMSPYMSDDWISAKSLQSIDIFPTRIQKSCEVRADRLVLKVGLFRSLGQVVLVIHGQVSFSWTFLE